VQGCSNLFAVRKQIGQGCCVNKLKRLQIRGHCCACRRGCRSVLCHFWRVFRSCRFFGECVIRRQHSSSGSSFCINPHLSQPCTIPVIRKGKQLSITSVQCCDHLCCAVLWCQAMQNYQAQLRTEYTNTVSTVAITNLRETLPGPPP
jgi:hypothetical protein